MISGKRLHSSLKMAIIVVLTILNGSVHLGQERLRRISSEREDHKELHERRVLALITKAEEQIKWRDEIHDLYIEMYEKQYMKSGAISARDLGKLRELIDYFTTKMVPSLESYLNHKIDFLNPDNIILFSDNKKSEVDFSFSRLANARDLRGYRGRRSVTRKIVTKVIINPNDEEGKELLEHLSFQVIVRLITLENISLGLIPFLKVSEFRNVIINDISDQSALTVERAWHDYINTLYKTDNLSKLVGMVDEKEYLILNNNSINESLFAFYKNNIIYDLIKERENSFTFFDDLVQSILLMTTREWDATRSVTRFALFMSSMAFGNSAGLVQSRSGYMLRLLDKEVDELQKRMKPLDVIFEKTPFRLTDKFIPGHYGHNAVWAGSEEELKEIGVWDELPNIYMNAVEKYNYRGNSFQADIRDNKRIIEALRPGVQINTLEHFLDVDDYAVMRAKECDEWKEGEPFCLSPAIKKEYLMMAFSQIGKDYDFAFDVNTEETIVCSELLYRTFLDIKFETTLTVGSYNITPDQVAYQGDEEGDIFTPVILFHKGIEITEDLRSYFYNLLHSED